MSCATFFRLRRSSAQPFEARTVKTRNPQSKALRREAGAPNGGLGALWASSQFIGCDRNVSEGSIASALKAHGIEMRAFESTTPCTARLVFFGPGCTDIEEEIRAIAVAGGQRLIVVATSERLLDPQRTWRLVAAGATDVLGWTTSDSAAQIAARLERWSMVDALVSSPLVRDRLIGQSWSWSSVIREVVEVARFTDASVLVTGESGTGKELVARLTHELDPRPDKRSFVVVDCTTVVPTLSGSEFFGHEKGAFTGAVAARDGAFALADKGTLFLDEISELALPLQAELLRVIQEGVYKRVGSDTWRGTQFRLVCATNRDLFEEQRAGRFRHDLYHRIAGWVFRLPSLRERLEDIPALARFFLASSREDGSHLELDPSVFDLMMRREYAGNVRDLRHFVWRMSRRHVGPGPITVGDVAPEDHPGDEPDMPEQDNDFWDSAVRQALGEGMNLKHIGQRAVETAVRIVGADEGWNLQRAAKRLGVTDRALQLRRAAMRSTTTLEIRKLGIDLPPTDPVAALVQPPQQPEARQRSARARRGSYGRNGPNDAVG
jgi:DNA-binding NtrC family response regulator